MVGIHDTKKIEFFDQWFDRGKAVRTIYLIMSDNDPNLYFWIEIIVPYLYNYILWFGGESGKGIIPFGRILIIIFFYFFFEIILPSDYPIILILLLLFFFFKIYINIL